ncbi:MAG: nucleotidyltransferase domain-containing protein [Pseudomonadota bacterium]
MEKAFREIVGRYELAEVYAFGSRATEVAECLTGKAASIVPRQSDVDIGIMPKRGMTLNSRDRVYLAMELEDFLKVPRVDLVMIPEAEPFLALEIIRGELLYAEDLDQQARNELYILRRAADLLPFKKERIRMIMEENGR